MSRPLTRLRHYARIRRRARVVGAADASGSCTGHMLRCLYAAQARAAQAGCVLGDVCDAVFDGLDEGRTNAKSPDP